MRRYTITRNRQVRWCAAAWTITCATMILSACGSDAHKGQHCTHSHTDVIPMTTFIHSGTTSIPITNYVPVQTCDQWVPDDPATVKP